MRRRSLRRQLVAVMTCVMIAVLVGVGAFLYAGVRNAAWQQHDDDLLARARAYGALIEHDEDGYEMELPPEPSDQPPSYIEAWGPDGSVLARSLSLAEVSVFDNMYGHVAPQVELRRSAQPRFFDVTLPDGRRGRGLDMLIDPRTEGGVALRVRLVVAAGIEDVEKALATLRWWFVFIGVAALAAIAALVWWVVGRGLEPLERLAHAIDKIDDSTLGTRLPADDQPVEIVGPVRKLNELLKRLETSFSRERQFTADVSHELRTPLAGLRTLLEVTALSDRSSAEYKTAIADARAIVLQLGELVENLLMLARLDAGHIATTNSQVALRELVAECWLPYAALAASRALEFRNLVADTTITIDREKLRLVLANLLANAAEYTTPAGWIEVSAGDDVIAVTDSGPPLPDEHKIFGRLWRGDDARASTGTHCGIGLALARSLCTCMSLELTAENRADGSVRFACRSGTAMARSR